MFAHSLFAYSLSAHPLCAHSRSHQYHLAMKIALPPAVQAKKSTPPFFNGDRGGLGLSTKGACAALAMTASLMAAVWAPASAQPWRKSAAHGVMHLRKILKCAQKMRKFA